MSASGHLPDQVPVNHHPGAERAGACGRRECHPQHDGAPRLGILHDAARQRLVLEFHDLGIHDVDGVGLRILCQQAQRLVGTPRASHGGDLIHLAEYVAVSSSESACLSPLYHLLDALAPVPFRVEDELEDHGFLLVGHPACCSRLRLFVCLFVAGTRGGLMFGIGLLDFCQLAMS